MQMNAVTYKELCWLVGSISWRGLEQQRARWWSWVSHQTSRWKWLNKSDSCCSWRRWYETVKMLLPAKMLNSKQVLLYLLDLPFWHNWAIENCNGLSPRVRVRETLQFSMAQFIHWFFDGVCWLSGLTGKYLFCKKIRFQQCKFSLVRWVWAVPSSSCTRLSVLHSMGCNY